MASQEVADRIAVAFVGNIRELDVGLAGEVTLFLAAAFSGVAAVAGLAEVFFAVFVLAGAAAGLLAVLCPKASDAASSIAMVLIARFIMLSVPLLYFLAAAAAAGCNVPES